MNNKRVYGSDEPVDSPSPDNALEVSPSARGPIAGSKRASGSVGRGATPLMNNTDAPPPTLTTTSGPNDAREDLNTLSVAGPASTPEKAGGLETGSPSPTTSLRRVFGGNTIPITTNDLGRLPLHYGAKFPVDFDFQAIASGWDASGSGRASISLGGVDLSPGSGQTEGVNSRGTQSGGIHGLYPPQEPHPEDLFPWIPYTTIGVGEAVTDSAPNLATAAATTRSNTAPMYVGADPSQSNPNTDQLNSTILLLFGDVPLPSSTALGVMTDSLPGPASNVTQNHTDPFDALFPPTHSQAGAHLPPPMQTTQQPRDRYDEQGYGNLPVDAQAYLHGWSNAPQAFEYVSLPLPLRARIHVPLRVSRWGDWSDYVNNVNNLGGFGSDLPDLYQSNPNPPA